MWAKILSSVKEEIVQIKVDSAMENNLGCFKKSFCYAFLDFDVFTYTPPMFYFFLSTFNLKQSKIFIFKNLIN